MPELHPAASTTPGMLRLVDVHEAVGLQEPFDEHLALVISGGRLPGASMGRA